MAYLRIIGASNTRNAFSGRLKQLERMGGCKADYVSATSINAGYKALKDSKEATSLLICFLLNGVTDATELCKDENEIQAQTAIVINQYCQAILDSANEKPDCQHFVMTPFFRSTPRWLADKLSDIISAVNEKLALQKGIIIIPAIDFGPTDLYDEVHLTSEAQNRLFTHISEFLFPPTMLIDQTRTKRARSPSPTHLSLSTSSQDLTATGRNGEGIPDKSRQRNWTSGSASKVSRTQELVKTAASTPETSSAAKISRAQEPEGTPETEPETEVQDKSVEGRLNMLETRMETQRGCMVIMVYQSANQADITDSLINTNNLNQVLVSGITDGCFDLGWSPNIKAVVDKLVSFTKVHPGAVSTAIPQQFPAPKGNHLPDLRIFFNCSQAGLLFRQQANKLRQDKAPGWAGIFVSNVATRATQVRVALLQAIAKALQRLPSNAGKKIMVTRFDSRPQLCFKTGNKIDRRLFYIDAIQRYQSLLTPADLAFARKIAGKAFEDRLRPTFAIL